VTPRNDESGASQRRSVKTPAASKHTEAVTANGTPVFELDTCKQFRNGWVAAFDCPCGMRHSHGLGNGPEPWPGGDRAPHCAPLSRIARGWCPCGEQKIHPEHVAGAERTCELGYYIVITPNTVLVRGA
jgi:hypothetical protein